MKLERKYLVLATVASLVVALDQLTKLYIHANWAQYESVQVIRDLFSFTYIRNTGAAFGIFREVNEVFRTLFFMTMPPTAMIVILAMLRGVDNDDRWQVFSLSLIFGGAIGNYIDRLRFGYVIDFLDFHHVGSWWSWSYPAFNIADSAIVVGVSLLLGLMVARDYMTKKTRKVQKA